MTLYLGVALVTGAVVLFLLHPVIKGIHASLDREDDEVTETEARKRIALIALRDVEYDFLAGKLDDFDYREMKAKLTAEALAALEADEVARDGKGQSGESGLEAEIAAIRRGLASGTACAECSYSNPEGSRFCAACGHALTEAVAP
jgi:hypothetical protein